MYRSIVLACLRSAAMTGIVAFSPGAKYSSYDLNAARNTAIKANMRDFPPLLPQIKTASENGSVGGSVLPVWWRYNASCASSIGKANRAARNVRQGAQEAAPPL